MRKRIKRLLSVIVLSLILITVVAGTNISACAESNFDSANLESLFQYVHADWERGYVEALVRAAPSPNSDGAEGILAARDTAIDNLHFDLVNFFVGTYIENVSQFSETIISDTTSTDSESQYNYRYENYTKREMRINEISRIITQNIELVKEGWDGDFYFIHGQVPLSKVSAFIETPSGEIKK